MATEASGSNVRIHRRKEKSELTLTGLLMEGVSPSVKPIACGMRGMYHA